jgi:hypothetical protein
MQLSLDTSPEVERTQIEGWRTMAPAEKAAVVSALTKAAFTMTRAGVRHRHPAAGSREVFLRMAIITLGPALASAAYPEARRFIPAS